MAMVLAHTIDSWTWEPDRHSEPFYTLFFIGGVASPLFLFLAGVAAAMSSGATGRRAGDWRVGARTAQKRGIEIFVLGLIFRLQSLILGWAPLQNFFKVDMLNTMGLSMIAASMLWRVSPDRRVRVAVFALATTAVTAVTPWVRATPWLAALPDPLEAYLRPAGPFSAFPLFPWAGFLLAGVIAGDVIDAVRVSRREPTPLQVSLAVAGGLGVGLAYLASFRPALFPTATFWHDSPTFFFIRLGLCTLLVPIAWVVEQMARAIGEKGTEKGTVPFFSEPAGKRGLSPFPSPFPRTYSWIVTLGRSSLFVYWIHVEMVYGVIAEPIKKGMPLSGSLTCTVLLWIGLYLIVLLKNRVMTGVILPRPLQIFAPILR